MLTAKQIIEHFNMQPLDIEGGAFIRVYESEDVLTQNLLPERYRFFRQEKPFSTAILFLLTDQSCSRLHRLPTDEVYHFYLGDPVELVELLPNGTVQKTILGQDILHGQKVQHTVQKSSWQGSKVLTGGKFALLGTTMAPGYTAEDFEEGQYESLAAQYPSAKDTIWELTMKEPRFY